jgi:hypothetical protein
MGVDDLVYMHGLTKNLSARRSTPRLVLAPRRRLDLDLSLADFIPVSAERCPATLGVALEHRTTRIFVCVAIDLNERMLTPTWSRRMRNVKTK